MFDHVPLLPAEQTIPSGATYNTLARLLKFLDTDTPDALQVKLNPSGGLRLTITPSPASAATEETYSGPFALTISGGALRVSRGYVSRNGTFSSVSGATLDLRLGTVCVQTTLSSGGSWTSPTIGYGTVSQWSYPIGKVSYNGQGYTATSYRVPLRLHRHGEVPLGKKGEELTSWRTLTISSEWQTTLDGCCSSPGTAASPPEPRSCAPPAGHGSPHGPLPDGVPSSQAGVGLFPDGRQHLAERLTVHVDPHHPFQAAQKKPVHGERLDRLGLRREGGGLVPDGLLPFRGPRIDGGGERAQRRHGVAQAHPCVLLDDIPGAAEDGGHPRFRHTAFPAQPCGCPAFACRLFQQAPDLFCNLETHPSFSSKILRPPVSTWRKFSTSAFAVFCCASLSTSPLRAATKRSASAFVVQPSQRPWYRLPPVLKS